MSKHDPKTTFGDSRSEAPNFDADRFLQADEDERALADLDPASEDELSDTESLRMLNRLRDEAELNDAARANGAFRFRHRDTWLNDGDAGESKGKVDAGLGALADDD